MGAMLGRRGVSYKVGKHSRTVYNIQEEKVSLWFLLPHTSHAAVSACPPLHVTVGSGRIRIRTRVVSIQMNTIFRVALDLIPSGYEYKIQIWQHKYGNGKYQIPSLVRVCICMCACACACASSTSSSRAKHDFFFLALKFAVLLVIILEYPIDT